MKEPWIEKLRRWKANPIPRRESSSVATWWRWGCRMYRVRQFRNPTVEGGTSRDG